MVSQERGLMSQICQCQHWNVYKFIFYHSSYYRPNCARSLGEGRVGACHFGEQNEVPPPGALHVLSARF